jgi:hypothetical protein
MIGRSLGCCLLLLVIDVASYKGVSGHAREWTQGRRGPVVYVLGGC